jgi:hypothetical protein
MLFPTVPGPRSGLTAGLEDMMRCANGIGFLICCLGLPLQAGDILPDLDTLSISSGGPASASVFVMAIPTNPPGNAPVTVPAIPAAVTREASGPTEYGATPWATTPAYAGTKGATGRIAIGGRLCRVTAYWAGEGDYYTGRHLSSTGVHLHGGHCAVDSRAIPYGSVVEIAGVGRFLAVDTGSAVVNRKAARKAARTSEERNALVVDLYFESRKAGTAFAAKAPKYAAVNWWKPSPPPASSLVPVVTPISMLLRLGRPAFPLRSPLGITALSYAVR